MTLRAHRWLPVYDTYATPIQLLERFYVPALENSVSYDRVTGYFTLGALDAAAQGIEALYENGGSMRLLVGELAEDDAEELIQKLRNPPTQEQEARLSILGKLLRENRLEIRVAQPSETQGMMHSKFGIFRDAEGDVVTFEGSLNETGGGWLSNYERFKVHRSWVDGERKYTREDQDDFESLWEGKHDAVDVYTLPEAIENELLSWASRNASIEESIETLKQERERRPTEQDGIELLASSHRMPGSMQVSERLSSITPWPHQQVVSDTLINAFPSDFLLCDEVGLGKTIEVGLTLSRLSYSREIDNALILAPASLVKQWQDEMWEKFNLNTLRFAGSQSDRKLVDAVGNEEYLDDYVTDDKTSTIRNFLSTEQTPTVLVASWHTVRQDGIVEKFATSASSELSPPEWDVVVADEAHNARDSNKFYELLEGIRKNVRTMYLLTATPMQVSLSELYDLFSLLDMPDEWDDKRRFSTFYTAREYIQEASSVDDALDALHGLSSVDSETDARMVMFEITQLIRAYGAAYDGYMERIAEHIPPTGTTARRAFSELLLPEEEYSMGLPNPQPTQIDELRPTEIEAIGDIMGWANPVDALMFRNTRNTLRQYVDAGILEPEEGPAERNPHTRKITLSSQSQRAYDMIEEYILDFYKKSSNLRGDEANALGFIMTLYRERLSSSIKAISESLETRREQLEDQIRAENPSNQGESVNLRELAAYAEKEDDVAAQSIEVSSLTEAESEEITAVLEQELDKLTEFQDTLDRISKDPKIDALKQDIRTIREGERQRILVFTQYTDTMDAIRKRLRPIYGDKVATFSGRGGEMLRDDQWVRVSKEEVKAAFKNKDVSILICTDAASEGLNFQYCGVVCNFDLPWNPMVVEQRIGRVDRIGQTHDSIEIYNYRYEGTVDGDIYECLLDRIDDFENVVGELQPMLAETKGIIREQTLKNGETRKTFSERDKQRVDKKLESVDSGEIEHAVKEERIKEDVRLPAWNIEHPDVGKPGERSDEQEPPIGPETVEALFTGGILSSTDYSIERTDVEGVYRLSLPLGRQNELDRNEGTLAARIEDERHVAVCFDPSVADEYPSIRLILQGDPLYKDILCSLLDSDRSRNLALQTIYTGGFDDESVSVLSDGSEDSWFTWKNEKLQKEELKVQDWVSKYESWSQ